MGRQLDELLNEGINQIIIDEAQEIVNGLPGNPVFDEAYLLSLGNSRVEIIARKFFRPYAYNEMRYGPNGNAVNGEGIPYKTIIKIAKEEFVKGIIKVKEE